MRSTLLGHFPHIRAQTASARAAFVVWRPEDEHQRAAQIAALPVVTFKGRTLHTIRCHGTTGRGPHNMHAPESLLWALISLDAFRCPYHPADMAADGPIQASIK